MKLFKVIILILSFNINAQNLVSNYSFENCDLDGWLNSGLLLDISIPEVNMMNTNDQLYPNLSTYEQFQLYWSYMDSWELPERRYPWCGLDNGSPVPTPDIVYGPNVAYPYTSTSNMFLRYYSGDMAITTANGTREYIVTQPESTIEVGHTYFIEVFMTAESGGSSVDFGTVDLFTQKPHVCSDNHFITEYGGNGNSQTILDIKYIDGYSPDSLGWTRFSAFFTAEHDFDWISVGGGKAVYWDDIRIVEVGENLCKDQWYFDNTVFNQPFEIFQAGSFIKAGTGVDPEAGQLAGPVTVLSTSHTIFRAGDYITLEPGFYVDSLDGAIFETFIEPCQDLCPPVSYPNITEECISDPTEIGIENYENTFAQMQWIPSTYLDDPNSVNPTFTPPGDNGSITYTVLYYQDCDYANYSAQGIYNVTVNYSDGLNIQPTVSYSNLVFDEYNLSFDITVNSVVNEVDITFYTSNGIPNTITLVRGIDFNTNTFPFQISNVASLTSCCANTQVNITVENFCNETATTNFIWEKDDTFGFITTDLQNFITPDGDGENDYYCFEANACSYRLQVFNRWSTNLLYSEIGNVNSDYTCSNWHGQKANGNPLNNGVYWVVVDIYNDCGETEQVLADVTILGPNNLMILNDDPNEVQSFSELSLAINEDNTSLITALSTNNSQLIIQSIEPSNKDVIITDNLGRVVYTGNFSTTFNKALPAGVYYVVVTSDETIVLRERIIIVN